MRENHVAARAVQGTLQTVHFPCGGDVSQTWAHWEWDLGLQLHATGRHQGQRLLGACWSKVEVVFWIR